MVLLYSVFLLSLYYASRMSRNIPPDAGFICDKYVVPGAEIKGNHIYHASADQCYFI
jgi:hypothetical protein